MVETFYKIGTPLHIALVTDTHNHPADAVLSSLRKRKPDLICIAGDFVYARLPETGLKMEESPYALALLRGCSRIAPTYVSLGNHEWMFNDQDMEIVRSTGVTVLDNEYIPLTLRNHTVLIGGLSSAHYLAYQDYCRRITDPQNSDLLHAGSERVKPAEQPIYPLIRPKDDRIQSHRPALNWLDDFCMQDGYKILLCHHPEYYPEYLKVRRIDLILSGHAHGGQIRIFGQGLYAPGQGILPALTAGVVDHKLVISRGLANNTIIPRLFNPEEIVYIR